MTGTLRTVVAAVAVAATAAFTAPHGRAAESAGDKGRQSHGAQGAHAAPAAAVAEIGRMAVAGDVHASHALDELTWGLAQTAPPTSGLPADDAGAAARLASSPRKGEFVTIDVAGMPVRTWVVRPQGPAKAPVVVVIHEIFGLSDWIRAVADQLAADGFIAVAPDLLSGRGPNGGDSSSFTTGGANMMQATLKLAPSEVMARLKAARDWGLKLPQANGKSATVGFCFGGTQSFTLAAADPTLHAAIVYYGTAPTDGAPGQMPGAGGPFTPSERLADIKAPVLGLYADPALDKMIGNGLAATEAKMKALGKIYESHVYAGSAHGFLRAQGGNSGANLTASQAAWPLTLAWIRKHAS